MIVDGAGVSAHIVFTSALTFGKREVMEQANAFDFWSLARAWFERIAAAIFLPLRCDQFPPTSPLPGPWQVFETAHRLRWRQCRPRLSLFRKRDSASSDLRRDSAARRLSDSITFLLDSDANGLLLRAPEHWQIEPAGNGYDGQIRRLAAARIASPILLPFNLAPRIDGSGEF